MATYISLLTFTEQGARNIKDSPTRAEAFDQAAEASGVRIVGQFWTIGSYDGVLIVSADDEQQVLRWLAELVAAGNVHTETLRAFDANEFKEILDA
jgi:uncharacterized protein with GYD domain